jgi:hypothetical protein
MQVREQEEQEEEKEMARHNRNNRKQYGRNDLTPNHNKQTLS